MAGQQVIISANQHAKILQYLAKKITTEWTFIGRNLGISDETLKHLETKHRASQEELNYQMLAFWTKNGEDKSREALAAALKDSDRGDLHDWLMAVPVNQN